MGRMPSLFLNPRRTKYLWIACPSIMGGAVWLLWLSNILRGDGIRDLAGQPIGGDFLTYYMAGKMMRTAQSAALYNSDLYTMQGVGPYVAPPFCAWLFVPFSWLPYVPASILWMALNLGCLWLSVRLLVPAQPSAFGWALTFMPVFSAIGFGQSALLSLLLLCLVYLLWQQERLWSAGLVSSIMLYKFPLLLGVVLLWLIEWKRDWRALAGLMLGGAVLVGLSLSLIPEASLAYVKSSGKIPSLIHSRGFPQVGFFSALGFWLMLLPGHPTWADSLYIVCVGITALGFYRFLRRHRANREMTFAESVGVTLLVTPYAFIYDWAILLLPAILLWQKQIQGWREIFALVWLATFWSRFLTLVQLSVVPFAVQVSVPVLAFALISVYTKLELQKAFQARPGVQVEAVG